MPVTEWMFRPHKASELLWRLKGLKGIDYCPEEMYSVNMVATKELGESQTNVNIFKTQDGPRSRAPGS